MPRNQLAALPAGVFDDLTQLGKLDLEWNALKELPPGIFDGLSQLRWLDLDVNELTALPPGIFDQLGNLETLELLSVFEWRTGHQRELPPGVFSGLTNLRKLSLWHNPISRLPPGVFGGLSELRVLNAQGNEFTELPPGVFIGLTKLESVVFHVNPGAPFPVRVELARVDAADPLAPGPARVAMRVPDGAPFAVRMPVTVQRGTASARWLEVAVGDTVSGPVEVGRDAANSDAVHVSFGQPPPLSRDDLGLAVVAGEQMVLFAESDNRSPVFHEAIPAHWLQAEGPSAEVTLAPYFVDPDGDSLEFGVTTGDGQVVRGRTEGGVLWMEPLAEGEAELEVTATDPEGLRATQTVAVTVARAPDPDRFNIELIFGAGFEDKHREAIRRAADRWEEVVTGDLPDIPVDGHLQYCLRHPGPRVVGSIDDVVIRVYVAELVHAANVVGCAGFREKSALSFFSGVAVPQQPVGGGVGPPRGRHVPGDAPRDRTRPGDHPRFQAARPAKGPARSAFCWPAGGRGVQRGRRAGVRRRQSASRGASRW